MSFIWRGSSCHLCRFVIFLRIRDVGDRGRSCHFCHFTNDNFKVLTIYFLVENFTLWKDNFHAQSRHRVWKNKFMKNWHFLWKKLTLCVEKSTFWQKPCVVIMWRISGKHIAPLHCLSIRKVFVRASGVGGALGISPHPCNQGRGRSGCAGSSKHLLDSRDEIFVNCVCRWSVCCYPARPNITMGSGTNCRKGSTWSLLNTLSAF